VASATTLFMLLIALIAVTALDLLIDRFIKTYILQNLHKNEILCNRRYKVKIKINQEGVSQASNEELVSSIDALTVLFDEYEGLLLNPFSWKNTILENNDENISLLKEMESLIKILNEERLYRENKRLVSWKQKMLV
jgi:hypothetical protein